MVDVIDMAITKLSAKGQIVVPKEMRKDMKKGEKLVIIKAGKQLIIEKVSEFISMSGEEFLKEIKKW